MSGFGSGRTRRHTCIDDCLTIDTAWLRKQKLLSKPRSSFSITWKKWTETNFAKRKERAYLVEALYRGGEEHPTLTLGYHVALTYDDYRPKQERSYTETIQLASTPCNYGGQRWWFLAPCCGRRVRVLYLNTKCSDLERITPQCRDCLDLHYASQMQSYRDRHITYEKYLLANYGYTWASIEYHSLKERYFKVTPEWDYIRQKSVLDREMHLLRLLIRSQRVMLRTNMHALLSLKSEEDRRMYVEHLVKEHGQGYALDLVRMLKLGVELERAARETSDEALERIPPALFETLYLQEAEADGETPEPGDLINLQSLFERKRDMQEELAELEKRKPAA